MKFAFIEEQREQYPVRLMCRVLEVSPSGYYAWRTRPVSQREMANQQLIQEIKEVFDASQRTYGSPRVYHKLKSKGIACSENRVARLMRLQGIRAKQIILLPMRLWMPMQNIAIVWLLKICVTDRPYP